MESQPDDNNEADNEPSAQYDFLKRSNHGLYCTRCRENFQAKPAIKKHAIQKHNGDENEKELEEHLKWLQKNQHSPRILTCGYRGKQCSICEKCFFETDSEKWKQHESTNCWVKKATNDGKTPHWIDLPEVVETTCFRIFPAVPESRSQPIRRRTSAAAVHQFEPIRPRTSAAAVQPVLTIHQEQRTNVQDSVQFMLDKNWEKGSGHLPRVVERDLFKKYKRNGCDHTRWADHFDCFMFVQDGIDNTFLSMFESTLTYQKEVDHHFIVKFIEAGNYWVTELLDRGIFSLPMALQDQLDSCFSITPGTKLCQTTCKAIMGPLVVFAWHHKSDSLNTIKEKWRYYRVKSQQPENDKLGWIQCFTEFLTRIAFGVGEKVWRDTSIGRSFGLLLCLEWIDNIPGEPGDCDTHAFRFGDYKEVYVKMLMFMKLLKEAVLYLLEEMVHSGNEGWHHAENVLSVLKKSSTMLYLNRLLSDLSIWSEETVPSDLLLGDVLRSPFVEIDEDDVDPLRGNCFMTTGFVDYFIKAMIKDTPAQKEDLIIGMSTVNWLIESPTDNQYLWQYCGKKLHYMSAVCLKEHFFVVNIEFNPNEDDGKGYFTVCEIYDSQPEDPNDPDQAGGYKAFLQKFQEYVEKACCGPATTKCFRRNPHYLYESLNLRDSPLQDIGIHDCGLFSLVVMIHLAHGIKVESHTFTQQQITKLRKHLSKKYSKVFAKGGSGKVVVNPMDILQHFPTLKGLESKYRKRAEADPPTESADRRVEFSLLGAKLDDILRRLPEEPLVNLPEEPIVTTNKRSQNLVDAPIPKKTKRFTK